MESRIVNFPVASALGLCLLLAAACERESPTSPGPSPGKPPRPTGIQIEFEVRPSILIEAESGKITPPMQLFSDAAASGGKYALAPEGPDHEEINIGGHFECAFTVTEPGEYLLWARCRWSGACGNSLGVAMDGSDLGTIEDAVFEKWHWVRMRNKPLSLGAGDHLLVVTNREDGSAIDQILLTQAPHYRPSDIENPDVRGRVAVTAEPTPPPPAAQEP